MEIFGSTLWAAEVAAGFQSSSIFLLACINGAAVPVSPFEPVPSWPKANTIPQELRWCCPFWCAAWLPVAWNAMPCREVEGSAQEIKFLTTVETSVGQGTASWFFAASLQMHGVRSPSLLGYSGVGTRRGRVRWMKQHLWGKTQSLEWGPDQKVMKHRNLCSEMHQGQDTAAVVYWSKECLERYSFLSDIQNPWDLTGIKRGANKGQCNGALLAIVATAA